MMELLAGIVVAGAVMTLVLEPLVRGRPWATAAGTIDEEFDFTDIEESESPKVQALLAIKEIEFDRETGKLSDEDYGALKATYQRAALAAIKAEEGNGDGQTGAASGDACPTCGPRPESSARFCSDCGQTLVASGVSARCTKCGELLPAGARFCGECGTAVNGL
jgi:hypothetical protein